MKCRRLAEESCEEQDYRPGWEGLQGSRALLSPAPPQGQDSQELTSLWWLSVRVERVNRSRAHRTDDLRAVGLDVCSVIQRLPLMPDPRFHPQHHRNKQKNKEKLKQKRRTNELNVYLKNYYFLFSHLKKIKIKLKVSSTDYKPTLQSFPSSYKTQKLAGEETMSALGDAAKAALVTDSEWDNRSSGPRYCTLHTQSLFPSDFPLRIQSTAVGLRCNFYLRHTWLITQYMIIKDPKRWLRITKKPGMWETGKLAMTGSPLQSKYFYEISKSS